MLFVNRTMQISLKVQFHLQFIAQMWTCSRQNQKTVWNLNCAWCEEQK